MERFIIIATRSHASMFGYAERPCRDGKDILYFDTYDEAKAKCDEYNRKAGPNCRYRVGEAWLVGTSYFS